MEMTKLKRSRCAVLHLVLKRKWYDMIERGEKREEYRDETPYWYTRILNWYNKWDSKGVHGKVVSFSRGYRKPTMHFKASFILPYIVGMERPNPLHPEWGEPSTPHYVIKLFKRIELED